MDPRWIVIVAANALLVFLGGQLNHYLAHLPVSVFLLGLFLPVAGLRLRFRPALLAVFLSGLVADAARPVPFGSSALLLAALLTCWHALRARLPREGVAPGLVGALIANTVLFFAQPLLLGSAAAGTATAGRVVVDFLASQLVIALLAAWFFALQEQALLLMGVNLAEEARQPGGAL